MKNPKPPEKIDRRAAEAFQDLLALGYHPKQLNPLKVALQEANRALSRFEAGMFLSDIIDPRIVTPGKFLPPPLDEGEDDPLGYRERRPPMPGDGR